jgi:hypothetical protein
MARKNSQGTFLSRVAPSLIASILLNIVIVEEEIQGAKVYSDATLHYFRYKS